MSPFEAAKVEQEAKRRLLAARKLSLVVDLDQTVIQACVEPTIGEWMRNPENPNHDAVKDVREFQLVEDSLGSRGCWYYIKLRPGLKNFLESMSKLYEMHIYTMGTRGYAQKIAEIIDPGGKYFGNRILSRDESGSLVAKSLQRLFPVDTKMVVIIDDRGDVWKWNDNLIKVTPYDFFVGIGDINSSFLPKEPRVPISPLQAPNSKQEEKPGSNGVADKPPTSPLDSNNVGAKQDPPAPIQESQETTDTSALEQLVSMGGENNPLTLQEQTSRQDETLTQQLEERPLLKKQLQLEQDDAAKAEAASKESHEAEAPNGILGGANGVERPRHHILEDHDRQLQFLEYSLNLVHTHYYEQYTQRLAPSQGGRIAELRGSKRKQPASEASDPSSIPDVKVIMPSLKHRVLSGVTIVLSGVVPLGWPTQQSDLAMWAKSFGARVEDKISMRTTHLVAARNRTQKVRQALKRGKGKVKIVSPQWLVHSLAQWTKLDEKPYMLDVEETETSHGSGEGLDEQHMLSESDDEASDNESDDKEAHKDPTSKSKPVLSITVGDGDETDLEGVEPDPLEDDKSPVGGTKEDWDNMQAELDDFLGSEGEDSEGGESVGSVGSVGSAGSVSSSRSAGSAMARRPKRAREFEEDDGDGGLRKRPAPSRQTKLSKNSIPSNTGSEAGTPKDESDAKEDEEGTGVEASANQLEDEGHEEDEDWAAELEQQFTAEMEKADAEDGGEG